MAALCFEEGEFDNAHAHVERAKPYATDDPYRLGRAMEEDATFWYRQRRLGEAKSEALDAVNLFEKLGATVDMERCKATIRAIEEAIDVQTASH